MSSNNYPACISKNLVRTSSFGYNERTNTLQHVLSTSSLRSLLDGHEDAFTFRIAVAWKSDASLAMAPVAYGSLVHM